MAKRGSKRKNSTAEENTTKRKKKTTAPANPPSSPAPSQHARVAASDAKINKGEHSASESEPEDEEVELGEFCHVVSGG